MCVCVCCLRDSPIVFFVVISFLQLQKALASAQEKAEAAGEDPAVAIDDVIQRVAIVNEGLPRGALPRYASFKLDPPTTNTK